MLKRRAFLRLTSRGAAVILAPGARQTPHMPDASRPSSALVHGRGREGACMSEPETDLPTLAPPLGSGVASGF